MADILVHGLTQNNLKHVTFRIPKEKITVFTGVSGSGKSSIVFDTIAAESQRQMNATYSAFVRSRLPKYPKPAVERIDNLTASASCFPASESPMWERPPTSPSMTPMVCARPAPAWGKSPRLTWRRF